MAHRDPDRPKTRKELREERLRKEQEAKKDADKGKHIFTLNLEFLISDLLFSPNYTMTNGVQIVRRRTRSQLSKRVSLNLS